MTPAPTFRNLGERLGPRGVRATSLALAALLTPALCGAAIAQQSWEPTVATAPGTATFHGEPMAIFSQTSPAVDPRYFPSPNGQAGAPTLRSPLPQGAWSPIVTGTVPHASSQSAQTSANRAPAPGFVPPIRPTRPDGRMSGVSPITTGAIDAPKENAGPLGAAADAPSPPALPKGPGPLDALAPTATPAQQYCFNSTDTAADARFAWQAKKIQEMEAELDRRSVQLEAKTQEYKRWLARRDEFSRKAQEKLVGFYAKMRPDAAALQLASMDEETAAAVLTKLETKTASAIMGEMVPEDAAKIATIISGAAKTPPLPRPRPPAEANAGDANATQPSGPDTAQEPAAPGQAAPPGQPKS